MADCHVLHPMRCHEHGRTVLVHADKWWIVLCFSGPCTARIRSSSILSVLHTNRLVLLKLTNMNRVDGLVELAGPSDWRSVGGLCFVRHGARWSLDIASELCATELADFSTHNPHHAHTWLHQ